MKELPEADTAAMRAAMLRVYERWLRSGRKEILDLARDLNMAAALACRDMRKPRMQGAQ